MAADGIGLGQNPLKRRILRDQGLLNEHQARVNVGYLLHVVGALLFDAYDFIGDQPVRNIGASLHSFCVSAAASELLR